MKISKPEIAVALGLTITFSAFSDKIVLKSGKVLTVSDIEVASDNVYYSVTTKSKGKSIENVRQQ